VSGSLSTRQHFFQNRAEVSVDFLQSITSHLGNGSYAAGSPVALEKTALFTDHSSLLPLAESLSAKFATGPDAATRPSSRMTTWSASCLISDTE